MTDIYDHPEWRALVAAVRAAPGDDLPRLVAADWLEDRGEGERAEFIRVQVELSRMTDDAQPDCPAVTEFGDLTCFDPECPWQVWEKRKEWLLDRERELKGPAAEGEYFPNIWEWFRKDMPLGVESIIVRRGFVARVSGPLGLLHGGECRNCNGVGDNYELVGYDAGPCPDCHGTGTTPGVLRRLLAREPVEVVEVTDREPYENAARKFLWMRNTYGLLRAERAVIPRDLWEKLQGHNEFEFRRISVKWWDTRDAATEALSAALIRLHSPQEVTA